MKKNNKIITIVMAALISILFTSCFDPIYNTILTDVKPEKPTVSGDINSIARYNVGGTEYLVLSANEGLRYKLADDTKHGSWKTYKGLPFGTIHFDGEKYTGKQIIKVVADSDYLYIATVEHTNRLPTNPEIWAGKITDWNGNTKWNKLNVEPHIYGNFRVQGDFNIFSTNDYNYANRKVYLRIGDPAATDDKYKTPVYYELTNGNAKKLENTNIPTPIDGDADPTKNCINSVVWHKGNPVFFNTPVSISARFDNENKDFIYYGIGSKLYVLQGKQTKGTEVLSIGDKEKLNIASLAVTKDSILIGCGNTTTGSTGGIKRVLLNSDGTPKNTLSKFDNNAEFQMPSSYMVTCLLNVTPANTEKESILYSTLTFPGVGTSGNTRMTSKGLWSYFPERGNWNRE